MSDAKHAKLTRIAFHEAGHAVAAWDVGARLHRVTIVPGHDYLGMVRHSRALSFDSWYRGDDRAQLRMAREIKISYAGALAVKRAFPGSHWRWGAKADFNAVSDLLLQVYQDRREQYLWSSLLMLETEALLAHRWSSVEAIVDALLKRRTLTGAEVKRVIQNDFDARSGKVARR